MVEWEWIWRYFQRNRKGETMSNFEEILGGLCVADNETRRAAEAAYEVPCCLFISPFFSYFI